ncbi:YtxH domain-containing protein [Bacillus pinisoli]|uniref:YtxH domain-containing protein n=1 Tax=Bacillus pinisoli TaxID=2901866 RepID=UPI001FF3432D|nr:YtxH domain-containing protein [Bacillus pinisoli]
MSRIFNGVVKEMKGNTFFLGVLVGGVIGGMTMLLSAPKSGVQLRASIKENSQELSEKLYDLKSEAKQFLQLLEKSTREGTEVVRDFTEDVQETISSWKKDIAPHQVNIHNEIKEIEDTLNKLESALQSSRHNALN